ncbi:MAG: hypothetical protein JWO08_2868 [Verrucomicrobiaceae bacterium]|nr:hypothetical protein [Verrucomicrobiaceae bacterium]
MHCQRYSDIRHLGRREWLARTSLGMGGVALSSLLGGGAEANAAGTAGMPGMPHFAPKAKGVIFLFMSGGMSQFESFDHKPELVARSRQPLPDSVFKGRKPLGMSKLQGTFPMIGSAFPFKQHGQSGAWFSDRFPFLVKQADRMCFLKGMVSEAVNHDPAMIFMNSGEQLPGRPSMGSWISYGLGSENENLPSFIVLVTKKVADQPLSTRLWDNGFLPSQHQGVPFRAGRDPVLFLSNPEGLPTSLHRKMLDRLREVQQDELARRGEAEIAARIEQCEMAFRMQASVPKVTSLESETAVTLERYGPDVHTPGSFAHNCVQARRLCENGVRFVQLYHPGWDHHGVLQKQYSANAKEVDQASAALLEDLHERGLLKDTLVVFGSEFGRTCYSQGHVNKDGEYGREHHRDAFTYWMAGAGVKPGFTYGGTDDFGFDVVEGKVAVNDLHATMLHLLGIDHERFTYRFQGRDFRLTDVAGHLVKPILA